MVYGKSGLVAFSYDALGRRIHDVQCSPYLVTDRYYTSGGQDIEDRRAELPPYSQQVYGIGYVNDVVLRDRNADASGGTGSYGLSGSGLEERLFAQQDANYNVTALVNPSGTVQQRFVYDPYGSVTVLSPSWASATDAYDWQYLFQGMRQDTQTGLYYTPNRDYSPVLGRWMEQDPAGYVDGGNLYAVEDDNAVNNTDPSGCVPEPTLGINLDVPVASVTDLNTAQQYADQAYNRSAFYWNAMHTSNYVCIRWRWASCRHEFRR